MKKSATKFLAILASITLIAQSSAIATSYADTQKNRFDVNEDGNINILDIILIKSHILEPEGEEIRNFTVADLLNTEKYILGAISSSELNASDPSVQTWVNPKKEDLVRTDFCHNNDVIDDDTYAMLLNTAQEYGFENYEIVWSNTPIAYAYTNPGLLHCMVNGMAYGYSVQVAPSEDITKIGPGLKKLTQTELSTEEDYICFRQIRPDDNKEEVLENFQNSYHGFKDSDRFICGIDNFHEIEYFSDFELITENYWIPFEFANWYLIPVTPTGERILELNLSVPAESEKNEVPTSKYWFTLEELSPDGYLIDRNSFNSHIYTANYYNFANFKMKSSEEFIYGAYTTGCLPEQNLYGSCQIVDPQDFLEFWPEMEEFFKLQGESIEGTLYDLETLMNRERVYFYACVPKEFEIQPFPRDHITYGFSTEDWLFPDAHNYGYSVLFPRKSYMIELDENGNEVYDYRAKLNAQLPKKS